MFFVVSGKSKMGTKAQVQIWNLWTRKKKEKNTLNYYDVYIKPFILRLLLFIFFRREKKKKIIYLKLSCLVTQKTNKKQEHFTQENKTHFTQDLHSCLVTHKTKQKNTFYSRLALMSCNSQPPPQKNTFYSRLALTKQNRKTHFTQDMHSCLVTHKTKQEKHILLETCTHVLSLTKQNRKTHFTQDLHSCLVTHKTKQEKHILLKTRTHVSSLTKPKKQTKTFYSRLALMTSSIVTLTSPSFSCVLVNMW